MQTLLDSVVSRLRKRLKTPTGFVSIALLVQVFGLKIQAVDFGRPSLHGKVIRICATAPRETQAYQIARACCAYALIKMKLIRYVSPHDLCVALCGVSAGDEQVTILVEPPPTEVQLAQVHELFGAKRQRRG